MGVSLHIQRADGHHAVLEAANCSEVLPLFEAIPWSSEMAEWATVPEEQREELRPLFQLFDDCGHSLHVTAYSESLLGVAYNYPLPPSPFGTDHNEEGYIGTDQFPRCEISRLFESFFRSDQSEMITVLNKYPLLDFPPSLPGDND